MLAVILGIVAYAPPAVAQSEMGPDGLYYYFNPSFGSYSVGGDPENEVSGAVVIPDFYNGYPVTEIRENGFRGNTNITSVSIGDNVSLIGERAFAGCANLKTLKLPYSIESIGKDAFGYDIISGLERPWLEKVYLNNIAGWCSILVSELDNPLSGVESLVIDDVETSRLVIPEGVTEISDDAFNNLWAIDEVVFPETLEKIGARAFRFCDNLCNLNLPNGLISIGECAFEGCENISEILDLSGGLESIGDGCFSGCKRVTSVYFGENIKKIGAGAFGEQSSIESVSVPNLEIWLGIDFGSGPYGSYRIGTNPLEFASHFWIGSHSVTSIDIPEGVTVIKPLAFKGGDMIVSVILPESLVSIGGYAFARCLFKELHCGAVIPPYVDDTVFTSNIYSESILYVPAESLDEYKGHSVWGKFLDIRAEGTSGIESVGEDAAGFEVGADGVSVSAGICVDVYSLSGAKVRSGAEGFVPLSRGCYILVIYGTAHKVMISSH